MAGYIHGYCDGCGKDTLIQAWFKAELDPQEAAAAMRGDGFDDDSAFLCDTCANSGEWDQYELLGTPSSEETDQ